MKNALLIFLTIISIGSFGQVDKIKIQKEKTEATTGGSCPFIFLADSNIYNKKFKVGAVMFMGKGYTQSDQKRFDENKPFVTGKKYLITYKSIQNDLKDWCNLEKIKLIKVKIEPIDDTLLSVVVTFGPK